VECNRVIAKGELYEYVFTHFDGDHETYKTCVDCLSVRDSFFCQGWGFGQIWGDLGEHLVDVIWRGNGGVSSDCMTPLTVAARERVCDMIERIWADHDEDEAR
jgi:hypothetical protein